MYTEYFLHARDHTSGLRYMDDCDLGIEWGGEIATHETCMEMFVVSLFPSQGT